MAKRKMSTYERLKRGEKLRRAEMKQVEREFAADEPGWEVVHKEVAGIDIGDESHFVAVDANRAEQAVREFGSWTAALQEMAQWLKRCKVKRVVMQTTGVYWIAVQDVLEKAGFEVAVVDARGTKNLPGRKSDVQECKWIRKLDMYGLLREAFKVSESIQEIRTLWRLRERWVQDAGRLLQQMQKTLTTMNVQLANTISDISGVTGMAILRAIVAGERDARKLAKHREPTIRASEEELAHSLEGNWREDLLFELRQLLQLYDSVQKLIGECDQRVEKCMRAQPGREMGKDRQASQSEETEPSAAPGKGRGRKKSVRSAKPKKNHPSFDLQAELKRLMGVDLTTIDGIGPLTAQVIYSELGPDLSAFPTESHFASWLGLSPRKDVSGGKVIKQRSAHVKNRVANALRMAANSLKDSDSYLGARYRTLKGRLSIGVKATKAMARHLACLVHRMLTKGQEYVDRGAAHFELNRQQHDLRRLQKKAAELGMQIIPQTGLTAGTAHP